MPRPHRALVPSRPGWQSYRAGAAELGNLCAAGVWLAATGQCTPELKQTPSPAAVRSAISSLAGRFDAAHALGADRCRMRGVRREHHLVSRAEFDVAAGGVEHDPAAHAMQHLFVAVLMPAVGVAGGVAPPVRAQAPGTHPGRDLGGAPSCRSTAAPAPIAAPPPRRECSEPPRQPDDGVRHEQSNPCPAFSTRCAITVSGTGRTAEYNWLANLHALA